MLFFVASCASTSHEPTTVQERPPRRPVKEPSEQLAQEIVRFSTSASQALNDGEADPAVSNSYSHQKLYGPRRRLGEPQVHLEPTDAYTMLASTDCSGWLSFVLNTVSPLHEAVLQSQRQQAEHNHHYSDDFSLREGWRPWARAFVVAMYLRSEHASTTGFEPVDSFDDLQPGDIGAYAMGRYAKPTDEDRPRPRDTGHVFVVVGTPTVVDPETKGYDGRGTLKDGATKVIAVPVVDSSGTVHFDPDSRKDEHGHYVMPRFRPHTRARAGGVGTGTIWFALNEKGHVLQRRLGPHQKYRPVLARAARLSGTIELDEPVLDDTDSLVVRVFDHAPREFDGVSYGGAPVHLTGKGGLRLQSGRLVLNGDNDFSGGVVVQAADLVAASPTALGAGDVVVRGGSMTLQEPALSDGATLSVAEGLPPGSIRLDFKGRDVVRALQLGQAMHRCGTWGGPDSKAMFVDPVFSGPGVLELSAQAPEACTETAEESRERRRREGSRSRRSSKGTNAWKAPLHGRSM